VTRKWAIPGWNRQIALFMLHSAVFQFALFGVTDTLLNFYFVSLGNSSETIGLLQALPKLAGFLTGVPIGLIADRIGAKRITIFSMLGLAAAYLPLVIWPVPAMLSVNRFLTGACYGASAIAAVPLMMGLVERKHQTYLFSYYQVITMAAVALGSLVGGFLPGGIMLLVYHIESPNAQNAFAYAAALIIAGLCCGLSAYPMLLLGDKKATQTQTNAVAQEAEPSRIPWLSFIYLSAPFTLFGFTAGLTYPFYNLLFRTAFSLSDQVVGTILGLGWISMGAAMIVNPFVERRFGRAKGVLVTMTISALGFFGLSIAPGLTLAVMAFMLAVAMRNTMGPLYQPLYMESVAPEVRNVASSVNAVLWNLGYFAAAGISGFWQSQYGFGFLLQVASVGVFLTGVGVVLVFHNRKPHPTNAPVLKEQTS